jgi:hypothetical protein
MERRRRMWPDDEERKPEKPKIIAKHTVQAGDTLSAIALKYYGSAVKDKYMHIYEANKAIIGDDRRYLNCPTDHLLSKPNPRHTAGEVLYSAARKNIFKYYP